MNIDWKSLLEELLTFLERFLTAIGIWYGTKSMEQNKVNQKSLEAVIDAKTRKEVIENEAKKLSDKDLDDSTTN